MKRMLCLVLVLVLLLSGCGLDLMQQKPLPDANAVAYRELRYFSSQLDQEAYMNMCAYYEAAMAFDQWCELPYPKEHQQVETLVEIIRYECPELMMVDITRGYELQSLGGQVMRVQIPYAITREEYASMDQQLRQVLEDLKNRCQGLSDGEKEQLIYDHISQNCIYDEHATWAGTAYGCLVEGKAKCDGISAAMKWALEECGIACMTIAGSPIQGDVGHAWNVVCIDDHWYDLDVTADVNRESGIAACYPAYNVSKNWIRDQYILDPAYRRFHIPGADDMRSSFHGLIGTYIQEGQDDGLDWRYMQAYEDNGHFYLQFEDPEEFEAFEQNLEQRLKQLGNQKGLSSWSWSILSVPDYKTFRITAGT